MFTTAIASLDTKISSPLPTKINGFTTLTIKYPTTELPNVWKTFHTQLMIYTSSKKRRSRSTGIRKNDTSGSGNLVIVAVVCVASVCAIFVIGVAGFLMYRRGRNSTEVDQQRNREVQPADTSNALMR